MRDIPKAYSSADVERKWSARWINDGCFRAPVGNTQKPSFSMVIPPPNVTGILHMGHALNNTLQDIITRYHRMKGCDSLWMPGTDHAGIATQNVVEKDLMKQGISRDDIGREKFIEKVWEWRERCGSTIVEQLKRLGCSCDWERIRFTMDEGLSEAVKEVFIRLYEKDLIYKSHYIINWCPRCQTALSDEESAHQELDGAFYHIAYAIKDSDEQVVIATTRPETMLGDTAIGFNPNDSRYTHLHGKTAILPIMGRELKIILDPKIDMETGTGALKITPSHDPTDFDLGKEHGLDFINIMNKNGTLNDRAGCFEGQDRFEARKNIVEELKRQGRLIKTVPHRHSVGHCYRCDTVVEPYCSDQWFVRMKPLAEPAIRSVESGDVKFHPERWSKTYMEWMTNIRDWCISRQIWWGHRIPVYYDQAGNHVAAKNEEEARMKLALSSGEQIRQDEDVLDTWFSSWLWPFSTMGWPEETELLKKYYPTKSLVTGYEIIFFWVARMMMAGHEFLGKAPFTDIYIHGIVRDQTGAKMSKSKGNVIDPIEIIDEYGADALRYSIISITSEGQDVFAAKERFEIGRNFANKIWNASRYTLQNLEGKTGASDKGADLINCWIQSRLSKAIRKTEHSIGRYRFNEAASSIYEFFWGDFCDWYLELSKNVINAAGTRQTLRTVIENSLKLLHPFMPFITEELWELLHEGSDTGALMLEAWPDHSDFAEDEDAEYAVNELIRIIQSVRNIRANWKIPPTQPLELHICVSGNDEKELISLISPLLIKMARLKKVNCAIGLPRPDQSVTVTIGAIESYVPLAGIIDINAEAARLKASLEEISRYISSIEKKLSNPAFVDKAPEAVVEKEKGKLEEMTGKHDRIKENLSLIQS